VTRYYYLDASALVKRYTLESGSTIMHELVERLLSLRPTCLLISWLGFLEIVAVLNRHRNDGRLTERLFQQAMIRLSDEAAQMRFLTINDDVAERALALLLRHNLNASDALYLRQVLDWQTEHNAQEDVIVLVAADERLLRAAHDEGLDTLSPETDSLDGVVRLLAV
jgi:predicted nucleic acid-binding protein